VNARVDVGTSTPPGHAVNAHCLFRSVVLPNSVAGLRPTNPAAATPTRATFEVDAGDGAGMLKPGVVTAVADQAERHQNRKNGPDNAANTASTTSGLLSHSKQNYPISAGRRPTRLLEPDRLREVAQQMAALLRRRRRYSSSTCPNASRAQMNAPTFPSVAIR
jgi:hypothetical protein